MVFLLEDTNTVPTPIGVSANVIIVWVWFRLQTSQRELELANSLLLCLEMRKRKKTRADNTYEAKLMKFENNFLLADLIGLDNIESNSPSLEKEIWNEP